MKIFVGRIDPALQKRDLEDYFGRFGRVADFRLFEAERYGFLIFENPSDADRILEKHDHEIEGKQFIVEQSKEKERRQMDSFSREPMGRRGDGYDRRGMDYDDYYRRRSEGGRYDSYEPDSRYDAGRGRRAEPCNHCDRCPRHGSSRDKMIWNSHLKVILRDIDENVSHDDLRKFARDNGFETTFARARGASGCIELANLKERDRAFRELDGKTIVVADPNGEAPKEYVISTHTCPVYDESHAERMMNKRARLPDHMSNKINMENAEAPCLEEGVVNFNGGDE